MLIALREKAFEAECERFILKLKDSSEELLENMSDNIRDIFFETMQNDRKQMLNQLFLNIYRFNEKKLEEDLIRCITLNPDYVPTYQERLNLMRWLWQSVKFVYRDFDYSELLDKVREMNQLHETMASYEDDVPFV